MTLGQFREITEVYGDDCILLLNKGMVDARVSEITITVDAATAEDKTPLPRIKMQ